MSDMSWRLAYLHNAVQSPAVGIAPSSVCISERETQANHPSIFPIAAILNSRRRGTNLSPFLPQTRPRSDWRVIDVDPAGPGPAGPYVFALSDIPSPSLLHNQVPLSCFQSFRLPIFPWQPQNLTPSPLPLRLLPIPSPLSAMAGIKRYFMNCLHSMAGPWTRAVGS